MIDPKPLTLVDTIWVADTWLVVGAAAVFGLVGGLVQAFTSTEPTLKEARAIVASAFLGAVAAVAILYIAKPADGVALIASSLVAGYAGRALMDALSARAKLAVSQQETAKAKQEATTAKTDVNTAIDALEKATGTTSHGTMGGSAADLAARQAAATDALVTLRAKYRPTA
jgi:hypothetical protein